MTFKGFVTNVVHPLAQVITAKAPRILMYHNLSEQTDWRAISQEQFEQQLRYLKANFNVMRLVDLARMMREGDAIGRNAVVLTFDDGYYDFLQIAVPLLVKYDVPATVFVITNFADRRIWLWDDAVHYLITHAPAGTYTIDSGNEPVTLELTTPKHHSQAWSGIIATFLHKADSERWDMINECQKQFGVKLPPEPSDVYRSMSWDEMKGLGSLIDIGSHSRSHPIFSLVKDHAVLVDEVLGSKMYIEKQTGKPVTTFCYPNGMEADYNTSTVQEVSRSGYECAVVAHGGMLDLSGSPDLFELPRMPAQHSLTAFKAETSGLRYLKDRYVPSR